MKAAWSMGQLLLQQLCVAVATLRTTTDVTSTAKRTIGTE
jgi:hypothetical protein